MMLITEIREEHHDARFAHTGHCMFGEQHNIDIHNTLFYTIGHILSRCIFL